MVTFSMPQPALRCRCLCVLIGIPFAFGAVWDVYGLHMIPAPRAVRSIRRAYAELRRCPSLARLRVSGAITSAVRASIAPVSTG